MTMGRVVAELSMSLDGHIAGPGVTFDEPMGGGGEQLFDWLYADRSDQEAHDLEVDYYSGVGALIVGRRMADVGIEHWGDNPTFHAPCFVLTHRPHETITKQGGTSYTFVTDGLESALERAQAAAGNADVQINGGAETVRQYLETGLLDELRLNLVPVLLGSGTRLFDSMSRTDLRFTPTSVTDTPHGTRIRYATASVRSPSAKRHGRG
jgi:dihydrofolate reductase